MSSQASRLLGAVLDRLLPSPARAAERSGPSYAWGPPSRWSESWEDPDRLVGTPVPHSGPAPGPAPSAEDVRRRAGAAADRVDVTVLGTVPAGSTVVDGVVEGVAGRGAGDDVGPGGPAEDHPGGAGGGSGTDTPHGSGLAAGPDGPDGPSTEPPRRLRDDVLAGCAIALVALLALVATVYHGAIGDWMTRQNAQQAASSFARAWEGGRLDEIRYDLASTGAAQVTDQKARSAAVARSAAAATAGLTTHSPDTPSDVTLLGSPVLGQDAAGQTATQRARVTWTVADGRTWVYDTTFRLREGGSRWRLVWSPQTVHPALTADVGLVTERIQAARADILGARAVPLTSTQPMVRVSYSTMALIRPRGDIERLAQLTGLDSQALLTKVGSQRRGTTIEVAMLRAGRWRQVGREVLGIEGTTVTRTVAAIPRTPTYGRAQLGEALPATPALARRSGGRVVAGELVGTSGLQRSLDEQLRGTPGQRVVVAPLPTLGEFAPHAVAAGAPPGGDVLAVLARPVPGTPVRLTLDTNGRATAQRGPATAPSTR